MFHNNICSTLAIPESSVFTHMHKYITVRDNDERSLSLIILYKFKVFINLLKNIKTKFILCFSHQLKIRSLYKETLTTSLLPLCTITIIFFSFIALPFICHRRPSLPLSSSLPISIFFSSTYQFLCFSPLPTSMLHSSY